jgi:hypothetical protein
MLLKRSAVSLVVLALGVGLGFAEDAGTVSGTFTAAVDDGVVGYLKLIEQNGNCQDPDPGPYATMATFAEGKAAYSLDGVPNGAYTACAFIDVHTSEGGVSADSGDLATMQPVTVDGDTVVDFAEEAWFSIP